MKLAEALLLRVDLQKKLRQIEVRLVNNAKMQGDEPPSESPVNLLLEFDDCNKQWEDLVRRINKTNSLTMTETGTSSIADMIIKRDAIKQKINALYKLSASATIELNRYSRSEIIQRSAISVPDIQNQIDEQSRDYRELDTKLQALNWNTDLL
jgi:cell fate (sporulation/competence/biofilm development) regulator YmcA (YheA/YmcA/DUF963 family)